MSLGKLLDDIRNYDLERLRQAVEARRGSGAQVITEEALRTADGALATDGELALPMRVDVVVLPTNGDPVESLMVDTERMLGFEPVSFTWEGRVEVRVEPFQWSSCRLALQGAGLTVRPFRGWFARWFEGPAPSGPWKGVVHFMSDPEVTGEGMALVVDLGSAPVKAFEELLDAARDAGAARVRVHSGA